MRKIMLLFAFFGLLGVQVFAQKTITGTVTSADDGSTLPGVSVLVKGTTIATVTDINGKYVLKNVPNDATTLVFSFMGMQTQEVPINGDVVDCAMKKKEVALNEVVVTALGISREKKALGYNVQEVDAKDVQSATTTDVVNALSSKTSGVSITSSSGDAGASSYIVIRGASSISGNNQPLFVVDGVPIESGSGESGNDVAGVNRSSRTIDINPEDIQSISVLKGGAATALYGLRAANGVILITTKKGAKNSFSVSVNSYVKVAEISQHIQLQNLYGQGINGQWQSGYNGAWGPKLDTCSYSTDPSVDLFPTYDVDGAIVSKNDPLANGKPVKTYDQYSFFQKAISYSNDISISAGNDKSQYFFSASNLNQKGIVPNNYFKRTSFRINASTNLTKKFSTGVNATYVSSSGNFIQKGSNIAGIMLGLTRTPSTFNDAAGYEFPDGTQRTYRHGGGYNNPYWTANKDHYYDVVNRVIGSAHLKYDVLPWMNIMYRLGTDWYIENTNNEFAVNDRANPAGYFGRSSSFSDILNSDLMLNINKKINENIGINVTLGQNMYQNYYTYVSGSTKDISIPDFYQLSNTSGQLASNGVYEYRTAALYGDFNLALYNMLYLDATLRNEWSTTMPVSHLSALYPSFSAGFVFSNLLKLDFLDFGKLRASWAKTANIASMYSTTTPFTKASAGDGWTTGISFPFNGATGYMLSYGMGNPDLKHETQRTFELGLNLKMFKDRVGIDFSYFNNYNYNLLLNVPIAASSGFGSVYMNAASMSSHGIEATLNLTPVKTKSFKWDITANFTKYRNIVDKLAPGVNNVFLGGFTIPQVRAVAGMDYGTIYGNDWWRDANGNVLINDDPTDNHPDGYPWTNDTAMVPLQKITPDWTLNIANNLTYKGFSLYMLWDIKVGGYMWNGTRFTLNYFGQTMETTHRDVVYNPDGTINYDKTPASNLVVFNGVYGHVVNNKVISNGTPNTTRVVLDQAWFKGHGGNFGGGPDVAAIERTDWVRLRQITLSYNFSSNLLSNTFIKGIQVYATGTNLFLKTPYTGIDPETSLTGASNAQGFDYFNNPGTKSVTFGLKLKF